MDDVQKQAVLSLVRNALIALGTLLTSHGVIKGDTVDLIVGAVAIVLPAGWGVWQKFHAETKTQAREVVAVNAGIAASNLEPGHTPPVTSAEAPEVIAQFAPDAPK